MIGKTLAHYEIVGQLGKGGMGEVYRARDTRLGREVALKILPRELSGDPERVARFEREARTLASLQHANIASIYGFENVDRTRFLTMELIEGEDLSDHLSRTRVSVREALRIALQIAFGLEAAHEKNIVHRDLKPANIKIAADGVVKILDFGLARAYATDPTAPQDLENSPTITAASTLVGTVLGTAAYMSPEQATGKPVDKRADIWALGVVLFELLAGHQLFRGDSVSEVLASVLKIDPDMDSLPSGLPHTLQIVLRRCLQRDPAQRMHDVADVRLLLDEACVELDAPTANATSSASGKLVWIPWALLLSTLLVAVFGLWPFSRPHAPPTADRIRFQLDAPGHGRFAPSFAAFFDITRDGQTIVFAAVDSVGTRRLYAQVVGSLAVRPLAGTEGAEAPFIGSNGTIGFVARSQLRRTKLDALTSHEIGDISDAFFGGSFAPDGSVVFNDDFDAGLKRFPRDGGPWEMLTTPDRDRAEMRHSFPYVLPNGKGVVFSVFRTGSTSRPDESVDTAVVELETGTITTLLAGTYGPYRYLPDGRLLMLRAGRLITVPFDAEELRRLGEPKKYFGDEVVEVQGFATSTGGTLVYSDEALTSGRSLVWLDRNGEESPLLQESSGYLYPRLSPNGKLLSVTRASHIWLYELAEGRGLRLTQQGTSVVSLFSPDASRVVFGSYQPEENLYWIPSDGSGSMQMLLRAENRQYPLDWHEPSDRIVLQWTDPTNGYDIWTVLANGNDDAEPLLATSANERWASLSPDGRWITYASDESGRLEVYVRSFPDGGAKRAVSTNGGIEPRWSPRGDEIFFKRSNKDEEFSAYGELLAVPVTIVSGALRIGTPQTLFRGNYVSQACCGHTYDVAPDGQRFVMVKGMPESERRLTVELRR